MWESRTAKDGGSGNYRAALQPDGNFCIYDNGEWVWDIQTSAAVRYGSAFYAVLENDGNLCIYRGTGPSDRYGLVWSAVPVKPTSFIRTNEMLTVGHWLWSENHRYVAVLQTDGNLCVYRGYSPDAEYKQHMWCSDQTADGGKFFLIMQEDGNLCVYKGTGPETILASSGVPASRMEKAPSFMPFSKMTVISAYILERVL